jgi:hypothetical protein
VICGFVGGCVGDCETACVRLDACAAELGTAGYTRAECEQQCGRQDELYDRWGDQEKKQAFRAELTCLTNATCDEIAAGECYDDLIFSFDQEL